MQELWIKKAMSAGQRSKKFPHAYQVALSNRNLKVFSFRNYKNLSNAKGIIVDSIDDFLPRFLDAGIEILHIEKFLWKYLVQKKIISPNGLSFMLPSNDKP